MAAIRFAKSPSQPTDDWDSGPTSFRFANLRHGLAVQPAVFTVYDESIVLGSPGIFDREGFVLQRDDLSIH